MHLWSSVMVASVLAAQASFASTSVFFSDFESGSPVLAGAGSAQGVQGFEGVGAISGNFWRNSSNNVSSTLTLSGLAAHTSLSLDFAVAIIDSWDGASGAYAPDYFDVLLDGVVILHSSFTFGSLSDTIIPASLTQVGGFVTYGFSSWADQVWDADLTVAHTGSTATLSFIGYGAGYQAGADESWAIDNLSVSIEPVPVPAAGLMMAGGLAGLAALRRRKG